ncbi:XdhC family protein [Gordonia sp. NPDC003424]
MSPDGRRSLTELAAELGRARVAYAWATVVRAQKPTSAHAGDQALVTADGLMHGFVGGQCAAESVRRAGLDAIDDGKDLLLRILPDGEDTFPETPGARVVVNPCLSGGALEVFIEPVCCAPIIQVVGDTPIAQAVIDQARLLGFEVTQEDSVRLADSDVGADPPVVTIVSMHGGDEAAVIRAAIDRDVPFVGLVASRRRGAAVLDAMELSALQRDRVHTPAGLDIGAVTPAEIALSILAQVVAAIRRDGMRAPRSAATDLDGDHENASAAASPAETREVDPICGMTVVVTDSTPRHDDDSGSHWFCCAGCRDAFIARTSGGLQAAR